MKPRRVDRPLALYGKGKLGELAKEIFSELKIRPAYVMDKTCSFKALPKDVLVAVCVATEPYADIVTPLYGAGWKDIAPVWDIVEAYPQVGIHNGWRAGGLTDKDKRMIHSLGWSDSISFSHFNSFLEWRMRKDGWMNKITHLRKKPCLPSTLADIRRRQRVFYDVTAMDKADIHAEGFELQTIKENLRIFQKYRPKISVACYHSRDGLWKIPSLLMSELDNYDWKFRLHCYMGQGAYIYGTPRGRG